MFFGLRKCSPLSNLRDFRNEILRREAAMAGPTVPSWNTLTAWIRDMGRLGADRAA